MSNVIGHATLNILPSTKGFAPALAAQINGSGGAAAAVDKAGKSKGSALGASLIAGATAFVGPAMVAAGVAAIGSFVKGSISAAGDLEQSMGAIDAVFKGAAPGMHQFASSASSAFGLTRNEANELATVLGSQLKNGGTSIDELGGKTQSLIGVGADLAAMFGGSTSQAVEALSSALKGERDPIERYGVSLNQASIDAEAAALGFEKVGGSLSTEASQAATLSLIMRQTADAHGAAAREAGSLQSQQARLSSGWTNLQASIGQAFLPAAAGAVGIFADLVAGAEPFIKSIGPGLASVFGTAGPAFGQLGVALAQILPNLSPLGIVFQGLQPVLPIIGTLLAQIATILAGELAAAAERLSPIVDLLATVIGEVLGAVLPIVASLLDALSPVLTTVGELLGVVAEAVLPLVQVLADVLMPVVQALVPIVETAFTFIAEVIGTAMDLVKGIIDAVMAAVNGDWDKAWQIVGQTLGNAWNRITAAIGEYVGGLLDWFGKLPGLIGNALSGIGEWLWNAGRDLITGMVNGVGSMGRALWDGLVGIVQDAVGGVLNFLGIHSPSRLFRGIGENVGQGLVLGLHSTEDDVTAAVMSLASAAQFGALAGPDIDAGGMSGRMDSMTDTLGGVPGASGVAITYIDNSASTEDKTAKLVRAQTILQATVAASPRR